MVSDTPRTVSVSRLGLLGFALAATIAGLQVTTPKSAHQSVEMTLTQQRVRDIIETQIFNTLPAQQQVAIARAELINTGALFRDTGKVTEFDLVSSWIDHETFLSFSTIHQQMLTALATSQQHGGPRAICCFAPDTDPKLVASYDSILFDAGGAAFQQTARWSSTATNGGGLSQGDPTILTYSFPPDGTTIPDIGVGFPAGTNSLNSFLDGIYGSTATWKALYAQIFARWGDLSGNTYVLEPNDDGVSVHNNPGVLGVRGDLRMAGMFLDGNSGVLAYNNFPQDGDMVIDTFDNFYNDLTNNSHRLRNILAHEHGHGMGLLHVCPANETKLMEPFISTAYDGPQHDDIQSAQRHYGDRFEDNNTAATASALGALANGITTTVDISSDDNSDSDFYSFTIADPKSASVTMRPIGFTYLEAPQDFFCDSGSNFNSLISNILGVEIRDTNGITVLDSATAAGAGAAETATAILPTPGTYYAVVTPGASNTIQLYELDIDLSVPPFIPPFISLPAGAPDQVDPGVPVNFAVTVSAGDDVIVNGPTLNYRFDGGVFLTTPLTLISGTSYTATLPGALCAQTPEFFISVQGQVGGTVTQPSTGAAAPFDALVGQFVASFDDNFESNLLWSVTNEGGLSDGPWERGTPAGDGNRGDPTSDGDGSGQCFLTDNVAGNSDVDGGTTVLTSPVMDASLAESVISYWRWYSNVEGDSPEADIFVVEVSDDSGGSWTNLETVGPTQASPNPEVSGGWFFKQFDLTQIAGFTLNNQFRIRFRASDLGAGSIVEAGVDGVKLESRVCVDPAPGGCDEDCDGSNDLLINVTDLLLLLAQWGGPGTCDIDGSGSIDITDLLLILGAFGACP